MALFVTYAGRCLGSQLIGTTMTITKPRAFVAKPRCIYTGAELKPGDPELKPSSEHIIPLSLGGSNSFVTHDVSVNANNRAGNEIDDRVASLFTVAILRNRFKLTGHRKKVPDIRMEGTFLDMESHPAATMVVDADGSVGFDIKGTQTSKGKALQISGTEDWVAKMLGHRLRQAQHHGGYLTGSFGDIRDEEDIRTAVAISPSEAGREFKSELVVDLRAYQRALQHFMLKIGLCIGHRFLGPEWSFGPDGNLLRHSLFPKGDSFSSKVRGQLYADVPTPIRDMLDLAADRHSIAAFRFGNTAAAFVALFGGDLGISVIGLSRSAKKYRSPQLRASPEGQLFQLCDLGAAKPTYVEKSLDQMILSVDPFF